MNRTPDDDPEQQRSPRPEGTGSSRYQPPESKDGRAPYGQQPGAVYGQAPSGEAPYGQAPTDPADGQRIYGVKARKSPVPLIVTLSVSAGVVVLAVLVLAGLFLTGVIGGAKVSSASDFEEKLADAGEEQGFDHCTHLEDTPFDGLEEDKDLPSDAVGYVCASVDLTDEDQLAEADDIKVMIGVYSESRTDVKSSFASAMEVDSSDTEHIWGLEGDHWAMLGNAGSSDLAEEKLGGTEW